ncbi:MAG: tRNA (guanine(46)-N(7))-methyltransferase TrmB [Pseudomonadota bacterium]
MTRSNSRPVTSNQDGPHEDLAAVVDKHLASTFRRPIADHSLKQFETLQNRLEGDDRPLIFDSGCGVGESSLILAERHPEHRVVGIDQSAARLEKNPFYRGEKVLDNLILLRGDCVDLWRLAADEQWQLDRHCLLYPNPWPKKRHLGRRWHGHPVFPHLLALGGTLEVRSNWPVYIEEMALALKRAGQRKVESGILIPAQSGSLTPFERKYHRSGQTLYRLQCPLRDSPQLPSANASTTTSSPR